MRVLRRPRLLLACLVSLGAGACAPGGPAVSAQGQAGSPAASTTPSPAAGPATGGATAVPGTAAAVPPAAAVTAPAGPVPAGGCHTRGAAPYVLPDPACTPGATNPDVTPSTVGATICRRGWTATVRPPEAFTEALKRSQMAAYGESGSLRRYEEDHLVPLELGGAPADPHNLWPEPAASPNLKDRVESAARERVCAGTLPLSSAQGQIAADWVAFGRTLGVL